MKKFIAAFDGLHYSHATRDYSVLLTQKSQAHLVGVFLEDFTRHNYGITEISQYQGSFDDHVKEMNKQEDQERLQAIEDFREVCQDIGVNYSIHRDRSIAIQELLHESVFADLLIISEKETMTRYNEEPPSRFLKELLADVQCPVIVVPDYYKPVEKIIFLYDGEPSSVYAVKMFSYLLPALSHLPAEVVSVKAGKDSLHLPDNMLMKELMKRHYPDTLYTVLQGYADNEVIEHVEKEEKNCLVVTGSYSRSRVSRWIRKSMADGLIRNTQFPLFIAHSKA